MSASQMYEIDLRDKAWHHKSEQTRQERAMTCRLRDGHLVAAAQAERQQESCVLQQAHQESNDVAELLLQGTIPRKGQHAQGWSSRTGLTMFVAWR